MRESRSCFLTGPALILNQNITSLGGFTPVIDETTGEITGYKTTIGGADTVFPFSGDKIENMTCLGSYYASKTTVYFPEACEKALVLFTSAYGLDSQFEDDSIASYSITNVESQTLLFSYDSCPAMRLVLVEGATTSTACSMETYMSYTKRIHLFKIS